VKQYRDSAGNWINQYRRGGKLIRLPNGRNFSEGWWEAYYEAERQFLAGEVRQVGQTRTTPNSVDAALVGYYRSTAFRNLAANSQRAFRQSLERDFRPTYGDARIGHLRTKHVIDIIAEKAETSPTGARLLLSAIRSFCAYCVSVELIAQNPTAGIKGPRVKSDGHHTWTDAQIAQFEEHHPIGSLARLAEGLHIFTAQRSSDVQRMGPQHIRDGVLGITQQKTGTAVAIPVHPELQCILDAVPRTTELTFLHAAAGKRFTDYNGRWREWVKAAGLPKECVPHGLRKAAARRLAEAGCTAHEIMAITGHKTLAEVQRYTDKVEMMRLARQAVDRTITAKTGT
jgi:integrase